MSKLLGIDYGKSKVGLALGDVETKIAVPLAVVKLKDLRLKTEDLIKSEEIEKIVVGLPLGMNGQETEQTKEVRNFVNELKKITKDFPRLPPEFSSTRFRQVKLKTNIEVVTVDERLSTVQAQREGKDDAVAAMYILQAYLDRI